MTLLLVIFFSWRLLWHGHIQCTLRSNGSRWMRVGGSHSLAYLEKSLFNKAVFIPFVDIFSNNLDIPVAINSIRCCSSCLVCVEFVQVHVLNWPAVHLAVACLINHAYYANEKHGWEKSEKSEHRKIHNTIGKTTQKQSMAPESGNSKPRGWLQ